MKTVRQIFREENKTRIRKDIPKAIFKVKRLISVKVNSLAHDQTSVKLKNPVGDSDDKT